MRARDLYQLLGTPDSGEALRKAIAPAMPEYRRGLTESGGPAQVAIESDGTLLTIAATHLVTLCEGFLAGHLDAVELGYIASALEAVPDFHFVSRKIEDITFLLSKGTASTEAVTAVLRVLREHTA